MPRPNTPDASVTDPSARRRCPTTHAGRARRTLPTGLRAIVGAAVALSLGAAASGAQPVPGAPPRDTTVRRGDWMISVNPLGVLAGGITGEVERKLGATRTIAAAVSYWGGYGGWSYMSADAKLRFYRRAAGSTVAITNSRATDFEALSYGPMVGFQRIAADACLAVGVVCSATGLTAGATVDYGWRLGREKQFAVLVGAGLKTGFGFGELGGARVSYPFGRLGAGYVMRKGR
jgi:hypothetical protein